MVEAEVPGTGYPGFWPDFRGLMSRTARKMRSRGRMSGPMPDVRAGRMSAGRAGCPSSQSEDELEELDFGGGN